MHSVIHKQHTQCQHNKKYSGKFNCLKQSMSTPCFRDRDTWKILSLLRCLSHVVLCAKAHGCSAYASGFWFCGCGCRLCLTCFCEAALSMRPWQCESPRRKRLSGELNSDICLRCHDCHLSGHNYNKNS